MTYYEARPIGPVVRGRNPVSGALFTKRKDAVAYGKEWDCHIVSIEIKGIYTPNKEGT